MKTIEQLETQIDAIDERLRSGIRSTSTDGTSVTVDLVALRDERDRLMKELDHRRKHTRRPVVSRIRLG
ncbi:hypothetical protein [Roseiconus lacunae]|uniref:hypothetical protein n=1 Tax=Roseiconus lacunae TaxID=2605694 RepID=UPI001E4EC8CE|nr:hypothetical protein [Roseiconus lacunae]MCD0459947.1 hypothetical protein [Roseiconus lacunae]